MHKEPALSVISTNALPVRAVASEHQELDSQKLFQGLREIWIVHDGERYRLRITRRGKLILQK